MAHHWTVAFTCVLPGFICSMPQESSASVCAQGPVCAGRGPGLGEAAALPEAAAQRDNAARSHSRFAALQMGMLNCTYLTVIS